MNRESTSVFRGALLRLGLVLLALLVCGPPLRAFSPPPAGDAYLPGPNTPLKGHYTAKEAENNKFFIGVSREENAV